MAITTYEKSNSVEQVRLNRFDKQYLTKLLNASETSTNRNLLGQSLLDYLCGKFNIPRCFLEVRDIPRPSRGRGQLHGVYRVNTHHIVVYNITAKTKRPIAIKTFTDTLLHEFMHHYDYKVLKLVDSKHTSGFYKRIGDLRQKLAA